MKIERNQLLSVLSEAQDCVEKEVFGATNHHAKRVAWLSVEMGRSAGMTQEELSDLAAAALLHDNALNEYRRDYENGILRKGVTGKDHCVAGEENMQMIPGLGAARGFVLYHHENADGSGPFSKREEETPFGAQLIHIADEVDVKFPLGSLSRGDLKDIEVYVKQNEGRRYGRNACRCFLAMTSGSLPETLGDENIDKLQLQIEPVWMDARGDKTPGIYSLAGLFARMIDYKSPFTRKHSVGIAEKAEKMAHFYGMDDETAVKLYLAGALHDIGKLMIKKDVLEKRGRLDETEYRHIQTHAHETWRLLSKIEGLGEVAEWASFHHEKLNGLGYPFGKRAEELNRFERLLACLDIYQALTEERPYKAGMAHAKAVGILYGMAEDGELDGSIVSDIDRVFKADALTGEAEDGQTALFQCRVCGYIYEGDAISQGFCCPVCGQPETAFIRIL